MQKRITFPEKGWTGVELTEKLPICKSGDARWDQGKIFGFVYHPGNYYASVSEEYLRAFMYDSTLNPSTFPSLKNFEKDIINMAVELMHGNKNTAGNVTTGGTESIFLALKVARDLAREREGQDTHFEVILPETIHPAFLKACHYLSLKAILVPVAEDKRADPDAMQSAITEKTILMCCSAPCFPYGIVDPVSQIGQVAIKHNLLLHVDACLGGFMLPFLEETGYSVPLFDFRAPGVTSISLDAHKYGYAPKGVSIILYRNRKMRKQQFFIHTEWQGGIFASTTFMGTKSGGPLAGCWAIMKHMGREGYRTIAGEVMKTTLRLKEGIQEIDTLRVIAEPQMSILAFTSSNGDIYNIGDALASRGWHLDRLQFPEALHLTVTQLNIGMEKHFLLDLKDIVGNEPSLTKERKSTGTSVKLASGLIQTLPASVVGKISRKVGALMSNPGKGSHDSQAALYGISASLGNRKNVKKLVANLLDGMF